jgi:hypothetical protein
MFKSLLLTIVFFLTSATAPVASKVDGALPGELLYRIDRILEDMQLKNTRTPEERVQLRLLFMQERLQETQSLLEQGDAVNLPTALDGLDISLEELEDETLQADPDGDGGVIDVVDEVFDGPEYSPDLVNQGFYCSNLDAYYHPVGYKIADRYETDYAEGVMSWFCAGYGLGEVKLAYQISENTELEVGDLFAMRELGLGWGQIMHLPGRTDDANLPDDSETEETDDLENPDEDEEVLEELDESEPSDEEDPTQEDEDSGEKGAYCVGADPHPMAERLAYEYGVEYDVIMSYFCQGYGFGEIMLAYNIANTLDDGDGEQNVAVEEVFGLRAGGMGWGQIMQGYGLVGNPKDHGNESEDDGDPEDDIDSPDDVEPPDDMDPIDDTELESHGKPENVPGGKPESTPGGKPEDQPGGKPENTPGGKPEDTPGGKPDKTTGKPDKAGKPNK